MDKKENHEKDTEVKEKEAHHGHRHEAHDEDQEDHKKKKKKDETEELKQLVEKKDEEIKALQEKMLYSQAEFENFKKLKMKEKLETLKFGNESLIKEFIPVVDNLEMALDHVAKTGDFKSIHEGVQLTLNEFLKVLEKAGVTRIVVSSPHCYHTLKNEYPELGAKFEVVHSSQFVAELIRDKKIQLTKELKKKVTLHDSCYLGRHNNVYDEPRYALKNIPGLELVEMLNNRENGLCCGGGGGRIWAETKRGERFSDIRIQQAIDTGASTLAVACPYCMANFEDSVLSMEKGGVLEVKEIVELIADAI